MTGMAESAFAAAARVAMGLLQWPPEVFWRATPAELRLALEGRIQGPRADPPVDRAELTALCRRFPDQSPGH